MQIFVFPICNTLPCRPIEKFQWDRPTVNKLSTFQWCLLRELIVHVFITDICPYLVLTVVLMAVAIITTPTQLSAAVTGLFQWISMSQAALPQPRRCCMESCSCRRRFAAVSPSGCGTESEVRRSVNSGSSAVAGLYSCVRWLPQRERRCRGGGIPHNSVYI